MKTMRIAARTDWTWRVTGATWAALAAVTLGGAARAEAADRRPNILFIFTDDHASHAIGAYGSKINRTPNLDRLAGQGMLFRNCFCTNSICGPSRAVILTGKHSHLNGMIDNATVFDGTQQTFPKLMRKAGYQTVMLGKWHLRTEPTGFDYWKVLIGQGPYYNPPMRTPAGRVDNTGYTTDIITDLTLDWLKTKRDKSKPFMVMCQHKAPHREWQPGPKHLDLYDDVKIPEPATLFDDWANRTRACRMQEMTIAEHMNPLDLKLRPPRNLTDEQAEKWHAAYDPKNKALAEANLSGKELVRWKYQRYVKDYLRCIASVDDNVGRLLDYLDESGLADNTVVIYSSDQGFYLGDHGWYDKRWMYEESLRMPLIVRWPGKTKPGSVNEDLVQNLDFAETFLDLAGVESPADMQGKSITPLLEGKRPADWRKSIYYHYWEYPAVHMVNRHYGVRTEHHKLIYYYELKEWELFDLDKDPDELKSVYADPAYSDVVKELTAELKRLQAEYKDTNPHIPRSEIQRRRARSRTKQVKLAKVLQLADREAKLTRKMMNLDPAGKPLTVGARCTPVAGDGVVIAQGGESLGYSLYVAGGVPRFAVRDSGTLREAVGPTKLTLNKPVHLAGVLDGDGKLRLYVDGQPVAEAKGHFISRKPSDGLSIGADTGSHVAGYQSDLAFRGKLQDIRVYWGALDKTALSKWAAAE